MFVCSLLAGMTQCKQDKLRALGIIGAAPPGRFVPQCTMDGNYQSVQCMDGYCWCVDIKGRALPGTRAKGQVNCGKVG